MTDFLEGKLLNCAYDLLRKFQHSGKTISCAESCSGGFLSKMLTEFPGSSDIFVGGIVSYTDTVKRDLLQIPENILQRYTAVSPQCAKAMAENVRAMMHTTYALGITGYAGPGGGDAIHPVTTVYIAIAQEEHTRVYRLFLPAFSRNEIRQYITLFALKKLLLLP